MISVPQRYFLIQIPGWVLAAIILYAFHRLLALPLWLAAILMVADIVKDIVLYPYLRRAYETMESMPAERLIGERAVIRQALTPEGYVQVRGELWRARSVDPETPTDSGSGVVIVGAQGTLLDVAPAPEAKST